MQTGDAVAVGHQRKAAAHDRWAGTIALLGFVFVATARVTNMILARGLAGTVPPFTLAFFRWAIIAVLAPVIFAGISLKSRASVENRAWLLRVSSWHWSEVRRCDPKCPY